VKKQSFMQFEYAVYRAAFMLKQCAQNKLICVIRNLMRINAGYIY